MIERADRLKRLMAKHGLTAAETGKILNRTEKTVLMWRSHDTPRPIPGHMLELLEAKLTKFKR